MQYDYYNTIVIVTYRRRADIVIWRTTNGPKFEGGGEKRAWPGG